MNGINMLIQMFLLLVKGSHFPPEFDIYLFILHLKSYSILLCYVILWIFLFVCFLKNGSNLQIGLQQKFFHLLVSKCFKAAHYCPKNTWSSCPMFCIEEALCLLINNFRYSAEKNIPLLLQSKLKYSIKAVGVWVLWGMWGTFWGVKTNRGKRGLEGVISGKWHCLSGFPNMWSHRSYKHFPPGDTSQSRPALTHWLQTDTALSTASQNPL